jgi:hypothetical protein
MPLACTNCGVAKGVRQVPLMFAISFASAAVLGTLPAQQESGEDTRFPFCGPCGATAYNNWMNNPLRVSFAASFTRKFIDAVDPITHVVRFTGDQVIRKTSAYHVILAARLASINDGVAHPKEAAKAAVVYACSVCTAMGGVALCIRQSHTAASHGVVYPLAKRAFDLAALHGGDMCAAVSDAAAAAKRSSLRTAERLPVADADFYDRFKVEMRSTEMALLMLHMDNMDVEKQYKALRLLKLAIPSGDSDFVEIDLTRVPNNTLWRLFQLAVPIEKRLEIGIDMSSTRWDVAYKNGLDKPVHAPPVASSSSSSDDSSSSSSDEAAGEDDAQTPAGDFMMSFGLPVHENAGPYAMALAEDGENADPYAMAPSEDGEMIAAAAEADDAPMTFASMVDIATDRACAMHYKGGAAAAAAAPVAAAPSEADGASTTFAYVVAAEAAKGAEFLAAMVAAAAASQPVSNGVHAEAVRAAQRAAARKAMVEELDNCPCDHHIDALAAFYDAVKTIKG